MSIIERDIEYSIDNQLTKLGWILDHKNPKRNVFTQRPKTNDEKVKLKRLQPDYVLYANSQSNKSTLIIEAKKPNQPLIKALDQAKNYAEKLGTPIVIATDGYRLKTWHMTNNAPLFLNENEIDELISPEQNIDFVKVHKMQSRVLFLSFKEKCTHKDAFPKT